MAKPKTISTSQVETVIELLNSQLTAIENVHKKASENPESLQQFYTNGYLDATKEALNILKLLVREEN